MLHQERQGYKQGLINFFHQHKFRPTHFVTLTFRDTIYGLKKDRAISAVRSFRGKLNSQLFGRRSKRAIPSAVFLEGENNHNWHFHILMNLAGPIVTNGLIHAKQIISEMWLNSSKLAGNPEIYDKSGKEWFKEITDSNFVIDYVMKEQKNSVEKDQFQVELSNIDGRKNPSL